MKYILRITAFPFVLCIIAIKFNYYAIKQAIDVLLYGGEWITYSKDENRTIHEIYHVLKSSKIESVDQSKPEVVEDKKDFFDGHPSPFSEDFDESRLRFCNYCEKSFYATHLLQKYCRKKFGKEGYCKEKMNNKRKS
jgi:hypothetical protein